MLCDHCSKLAILHTSDKKCMKCQGKIYCNIAIICDFCSEKDQSCSICLKKVFKTFERQLFKNKGRGCGGCGK